MLDDILDQFNLIDRVQGFIATVGTYIPHRRSHKGRKVGKARIDGGAKEIHIDRMQSTGAEAERLLKSAHVKVFGRRMTGKEFILSVPARQAAWAELLLLRGGIVLGPGHHMIDPRNVRYAAGKGPVSLWTGSPACKDQQTSGDQIK